MMFLIMISIHCWTRVYSQKRPPHIVFILADDLGWNDISYHGSPQIPTPNIDALASSSLILHNYYVQHICTPSRGSLLTGLYPIRFGFPHGVVKAGFPDGLPLNITLMPKHLQKLGYKTHMIGKWHLGHFKKIYTPTFRGFDTFFGYYHGFLDYYDYTHYFHSLLRGATWGIDLHNGTNNVHDVRGEYSTDVFTRIGVNFIEKHDITKPLFLYMAYSAVHTGSFTLEPLQAPPQLVSQYKYIKNKDRRVFAGMVSALDSGVGRIFKALHLRGMLNNTIFVFSSDNGAISGGKEVGAGSNWPLRGTKWSLWEGGIRAPAFVWSPLLGLKEPTISNQLMHISDWLPTFYDAAGGNLLDLGTIDGHNMWPAMKDHSISPRTDILHNYDRLSGTAALRVGDYKLINGSLPFKELNMWKNSSGSEDVGPIKSMDNYVFKSGSITKNILKKSGWWLVKHPDEWRTDLKIQCEYPPPNSSKHCVPKKSPCLFNIVLDPCEYHDLAPRHPHMVKSMLEVIEVYAKQAIEPQHEKLDPRSDPKCHGFQYVSWRDEEYAANCIDLYDKE